MTLLFLVFGFELAFGIVLLTDVHDTSALANIGYILIASLLIGIARAWELVGNWNTSILSSIILLVRPPPGSDDEAGPGVRDEPVAEDSIGRLMTCPNR